MQKERVDVGSLVGEENHQEKKRLLTTFGDNLLATVRGLTGFEGIDFDELPPGKQRQLVLEFLQSYYLQRQRIWALQDRPQEPQIGLARQVEVNPNLIELTLIDPNRATEQKLRLAEDRKGMLAYFAVLTEQKVQRFLNPWINRKELASYAKPRYTLSQLDAHLLEPAAKEGILEAGNSKGYRLACNPAKLLEVLQSDEPHHTLEVVGFEGWRKENEFSSIIVEDYQLPFLRELLKLAEGFSPEEQLDIPKLRTETGLSKGTVYINLRALEHLGLISRKGQEYRVGDIKLSIISDIVLAQERPMEMNIRLPKPPKQNSKIESRRAIPLEVKKEEEPQFPEVSWREFGVSTIDIEQLILDRPRLLLLRQFDQTLTADFRFMHIFSKDHKPVFSGNLPDNVETNLKITLGILDFLGLGPKELDLIKKDLVGTISATILKLESSSLLKTRLLSAEIKARLAGLILNDIVTIEEGEELKFASVRNLLDEALAFEEPRVEPQEIICEKKEIPKRVLEEKERKTKPHPTIDEKLMDLIGMPFKKELLSALNQPSLFVKPEPPTFAFNYHRSLSNKAEHIPWRDLFSLDLAFPNDRGDYHPHLTPAGALVAALYLDQSVNNRVLAFEGSGKGALKMVAQYTARLLHARLNKEVGEKERQYLENCLSTLSQI